jgi:predicted Fe-Mo cluster-binding NifX family protein
MKVAVTSYGRDLSSNIDRSFGRAKWFIVVDTETGNAEARSNKQNVNASQGAGIQAARNAVNLGVEAVLTGNVGPNAFRTLNAASIKIFIIYKSIERVEQAVAAWQAGNLKEVNEATTAGHWV